jgi:hypothetical protein
MNKNGLITLIKNDMTGIELITQERQRQVEKEGWTHKHDNQHINNELAVAASCYAAPDNIRDYGDEHELNVPYFWPWHDEWWKPTPDDRIKELVKAGALIAAEVDRLQRIKS